MDHTNKGGLIILTLAWTDANCSATKMHRYQRNGPKNEISNYTLSLLGAAAASFSCCFGRKSVPLAAINLVYKNVNVSPKNKLNYFNFSWTKTSINNASLLLHLGISYLFSSYVHVLRYVSNIYAFSRLSDRSVAVVAYGSRWRRPALSLLQNHSAVNFCNNVMGSFLL